MQTANIMLHVGGDSGTIVPKYAVTVSEIAVLLAIHGAGSVSEIEPTEDVSRSHREEITRLHEIYTRPGSNGKPEGAVVDMFPGAAARAFMSFDELEIDSSFFKSIERAKPAPAPAKEEEPIGEKPKRAKKVVSEAPAADQDDKFDDDEAPEDGKLFG